RICLQLSVSIDVGENDLRLSRALSEWSIEGCDGVDIRRSNRETSTSAISLLCLLSDDSLLLGANLRHSLTTNSKHLLTLL
ncbi:hypothetical protein PFISCL1PPCAC_26361, partial [Pristionchus fissidentatus]